MSLDHRRSTGDRKIGVPLTPRPSEFPNRFQSLINRKLSSEHGSKRTIVLNPPFTKRKDLKVLFGRYSRSLHRQNKWFYDPCIVYELFINYILSFFTSRVMSSPGFYFGLVLWSNMGRTRDSSKGPTFNL